jgi:hypothetical protein
MNEFKPNQQNQTQAPAIGDVVDKAKTASREVQSAAADFASSSAEALKDHASNAMDAAKDVAANAQDRLQSKIAEQKGIGADYVNKFADTMRRAANQFDDDAPMAGDYIRKAAVQVQNTADALREGNFNDLVQGAQRFARSQPTAFFGLALLAGFGAVRFLKSAPGLQDREREMHPIERGGWERDMGRSSYDRNRGMP